jgi:intermediate filament protein if
MNLFTYLQDLNNETLNHLDAENRRQTLEEEMEFLKKVHEQVSTF